MWTEKSPEAAEHAREMRQAKAEDEARRKRLEELAARAKDKKD